MGLPSVATAGTPVLHMTANHLEQRGFAVIGDDFGEHFLGSLQDAENDGLASSTSTKFTALQAGSKSASSTSTHSEKGDWTLQTSGNRLRIQW